MGAERSPRAPPRAADARWVVDAYREYFQYVWALLGRLGVPEPSLEDVTQEVFLVLHRRRAEFRHDASVRTWLHGIALHTARRHRAKAERRRRRLEAVSPGPVAPSPTPETALSHRRALLRLDRLLATLSHEQREVFVLAEIAELGAPEIAALLGVKLNTVYSRLRLGRKRIRRALDSTPSPSIRDPGAADGTA